MGVHCWLRKALPYTEDRCPEDRDKSSQWILLVTLRWARSVLDAAKDANTSASGTQGTDQPFGGKFVKRRLNYLCCKC
jgi:hypothetical protein